MGRDLNVKSINELCAEVDHASVFGNGLVLMLHNTTDGGQMLFYDSLDKIKPI